MSKQVIVVVVVVDKRTRLSNERRVMAGHERASPGSPFARNTLYDGITEEGLAVCSDNRTTILDVSSPRDRKKRLKFFFETPGADSIVYNLFVLRIR